MRRRIPVARAYPVGRHDMRRAAAIADSVREWMIKALFFGLRIYTRRAPFKRGRGLFIRAIERLKQRGWPPPLISIRDGIVMEFEPSLLGWTLFERGAWEPEQTGLILDVVGPGAVT